MFCFQSALCFDIQPLCEKHTILVVECRPRLTDSDDGIFSLITVVKIFVFRNIDSPSRSRHKFTKYENSSLQLETTPGMFSADKMCRSARQSQEKSIQRL